MYVHWDSSLQDLLQTMSLESFQIFLISEYIAKKYPKSDIVVTGSNFEQCTGTYNLDRNVRASGALGRPVYKLDDQDQDRYIFYNQNEEEWRIGTKENLKDGEYFYSSEPLFQKFCC